MEEQGEEQGLDRRDFIKGAGAAGAAAAVAGVFAEAHASALRPEVHTGWESRQGKEYINRTPFEVDTPRSYEVVGTLERRDSRAYDTRARLGSPPREENSVAMYDAGDSFWTEYYEDNPIDGDGVNSKLDNDRRMRDEWWPPAQEVVDAGSDYRYKFATTGRGFLAAVRSGAYRDFPFPRPDVPPEEWDWADVNPVRAEFKSPELASSFLKRLSADFSGTLLRVTKTNPAWFYKNSLRGAEQNEYGTEFPIRPWWEYTIVVTRPMGFDTLAADPNYGASYDGYTPSSFVAWLVDRAIRYMGYPVRTGSPRQGYEQFAVPFAVDAGFGEMARTGNCVSPDMGGNFRQSLVFTNLPLAVDKPIDAGVSDFCKKCKICAEYCQTDALSFEDDFDWEEAGVRRWNVDGFRCSTGWNQVSGYEAAKEPPRQGGGLRGCRACISTCPWYRKNNWLHNSVRQVVARDPTGLTHDASIWYERNFYPRNEPDTWVSEEMLGVHDPPAWLITDDYIKGFVDTPMGEA